MNEEIPEEQPQAAPKKRSRSTAREARRAPAKKKPSTEAAEAAIAALNPEIAAEEHLVVPEVTQEIAPAARRAFRPGPAGWAARRVTLAAVIALVLATPLIMDQVKDRWIAVGLIYVIVGLSINILMGYGGQISLGHQAFVGVGALTSAKFVTDVHLPFFGSIVVAAATGAIAAVLLGFVALRLKGLYLALITLAYGAIAEASIFSIGALTGGGAGTEAPRPSGFTSDRAYAYLCFAFLALLLAIDWRLIKSKAGRAILAIRENELAAASFGINVVAYKLLAFVLSGAFAGVAGALFAHWATLANGSDFDFTLALTFVLMVAVGGLGSRVGIFIGSLFFAIFPLAMNDVRLPSWLGNVFHSTSWADMVPLVGALLLLLTLTLNPGGIAQQLRPITDWFAGKRFTMKHGDQSVAGGVDVRP